MTRGSTSEEHGFGRVSRQLDYRQIMLSVQTWTWILVGVGVLLRVVEYAGNRPLYLDERLLLTNLVDLRVFDFNTILKNDQLAAPGFLIMERMMVRLPLPQVWAARLLPFLCGIASIFLMRLAARRYVLPSAVPIAVGLFALNDWLLYYSAEIKQYSSDTALTLIALLLSSAAADASKRSLFVVAAFGTVGVWFSHPLAMVLGAVGTYLAGKTAIRRDWKTMPGLLAIGLLWAASFAACYFVSHRILSKEQFIWKWWDFAFLPIPPRSLADFTRDFWQVLNIFNSPSWVLTPLGVLASAFLAAGLFLIGCLSLGFRWRGGLYLLVVPLVFTLAASALCVNIPFTGASSCSWCR